MKSVLLLGLLTLSLLVGCGGKPPDAAVVVVDATAVPTLAATDLPAALPEPTATASPVPPSPSPTMPPAATPAPTETSTKAPTATPEPTFTSTVAPTATPQRPMATATNAVDLRAILRDQITATTQEVGRYRSIINGDVRAIPNAGVFYGAVDCVATVESYDRLVGGINLDLSTNSDPAVLNAYNIARAAIDQFIAIAQPWTDGCRQALTEGVLEKEMDNVQRGTITQSLKQPDDTLNQAFHALDQ